MGWCDCYDQVSILKINSLRRQYFCMERSRKEALLLQRAAHTFIWFLFIYSLQGLLKKQQGYIAAFSHFYWSDQLLKHFVFLIKSIKCIITNKNIAALFKYILHWWCILILVNLIDHWWILSATENTPPLRLCLLLNTLKSRLNHDEH